MNQSRSKLIHIIGHKFLRIVFLRLKRKLKEPISLFYDLEKKTIKASLRKFQFLANNGHNIYIQICDVVEGIKSGRITHYCTRKKPQLFQSG